MCERARQEIGAARGREWALGLAEPWGTLHKVMLVNGKITFSEKNCKALLTDP